MNYCNFIIVCTKAIPTFFTINFSLLVSLYSSLSMNNSNKFSLSSDVFQYQIQTSPIHSFILRINLWKMIFHYIFPCVNIEDIVDDISSLEFLIMIHFRSCYKTHIIDKFLSILSDRQIDRFSWTVIWTSEKGFWKR